MSDNRVQKRNRRSRLLVLIILDAALIFAPFVVTRMALPLVFHLTWLKLVTFWLFVIVCQLFAVDLLEERRT